jgi:hypothetical protein
VDPEPRRRFNEAFSQATYARLHSEIEAALGEVPAFRLAETPVFLPGELRRRCETAAREILEAVSQPEVVARLRRFVPEGRRVQGGEALPEFALVDFAVVRGESGALEPCLVEMQGFPSLYAFTLFQQDAWVRILSEIPGMGGRFDGFFGGADREEYARRLRRAVVGDCDPAEVVLVDLDPPSQKTWIDFEATRRLLGVEPVCLTSLELDRSNRRLFRRAAGRRLPVRRIYNRVVFDEIDRKGVAFPFDLREEIDVEWAPHPSWYWIWSKAALPSIDHPAAPRARLLSEIDALPDDLSRWILKPLFSFAGGGVRLDVTARDLAAIPATERRRWMLQEKIAYEPALQACDGGGVKVEIRMMFLRDPAREKPDLVFNLARLSRGAMLGVDFNRDRTWVGSSVAL